MRKSATPAGLALFSLAPHAPNRYALTRFIFLRALAAIYFIAFFALRPQLLPLLGAHGLLPIADYLADHSVADGFWKNAISEPTLFWLGASDRVLTFACGAGIVLSSLALFFANAPLMLGLWVLYGSLVNVGQTWFGFGWEILLLETGFLAIFCAPLWRTKSAPPAAPFVLLRWLLFRVMFGAGLIKLRGDPCWRDLSCLSYHYETQPMPNPLSFWLHHAPAWTQTLGVLFNHFAELVAPFFLFAPRRLRHAAVLCIIVFQSLLIASGNLSFLNWLTIAIALGCLDDTFFSRALVARFSLPPTSRAQRAIGVALFCVIAVLSLQPAANLFSEAQVMNGSFDRLHLVNTYGAFGSIERERHEIVLEGTRDPKGESGWREYEFKCKPSDPARAPCVMAPYHLRLDWLMWFAAMGDADRYPWLVHFIAKLLHNDRPALSLLANDPFAGAPPLFIRATLYRYRFAPLGSRDWWEREPIREYLPPLSADSPELLQYLRQFGWSE